jgi:protein-L-isoaspartate(D-aspartate) O-methyltransferase
MLGSFVQHFFILQLCMIKYDDTYRHKGLRKKLLDTLREKGITDEAVLTAMNNVPRHFFMDSALDNIAYEDRAFPIAEGQTISQPYTVAYQTQLLQVKPGDKILEVGTGSMYQATVLAEMGAKVFTIERQKKLFDATKQFYFKNKYLQLKFFYGDGFEGLPTFGPFDKIIITAGAPVVPQKLIQQLKPQGIMVIPLNENDHQRMLQIVKHADGSLSESKLDLFSFVPMLQGKNN